MSDSPSETVTAIVHPIPQEVEQKAKEEITDTKAAESEGESDIEESDDEIVLDEPSDTENYEPKIPAGGEEGKEDGDDDDDSCSSGEDEDLSVDMVELGGQKFYKLKYEDLEAKKKEIEKNMRGNEDKEGDSQEEQKEEESQEDEEKEAAEATVSSAAFKEYRTATIMDEDMEKDYNSDEDGPYNPINSDLSDIEYSEGDDRDTEDEVETEPMEGTHKKTGESLICLKMIEQLKMPPRDQACSSSEVTTIKPSDQPMECT